MRLLIDTSSYLSEGQCLAAFMIMLDIVTGQDVTRSSVPELLDDPKRWDSFVGVAYPRPDDANVATAIKQLCTQVNVGPLQHFAFANPSTDQGWALQDGAWQDPRSVHRSCRDIRDDIRAGDTLRALDNEYPYLACPDPDPRVGRSSDLDTLMQAALNALNAGPRMRILLAPH